HAQLVQSDSLAATLQATASGAVALDLAGLNQTAGAFTASGTVNGTSADLRIKDSSQVTGGNSVAQDGTWSFTGELGTTTLNAGAGGRTAVALSFAGAGDLNIGQVTSRKGDVTLSAGGSILDAAGGATTNVRARNVTLSAGGTIGTASDAVTVD